MAAHTSTIQQAIAGNRAAKRGGLVRALLPSFPDLLFLALLLWLFAAGTFGWSGLLSDADTGWHIRTGEYILDTGQIPKVDLFSFSKPGEPWFAWEWGADVLFALLYRAGGLKLLVLVSGVTICLSVALLFLRMLGQRVNLFIALLLAGLASGASSIHYLARPHVFTLLLLPCSLWIIERDRERESRLLWMLAPLTLVWTSLHGGFVVLIACLCLLTAGTAVEVMIGATPRRGWRSVRRYAAVTGACVAATFVNPYGYQLHIHVAKYLSSDWIRRMVQEFQSPDFRGETALQYEALLFAGILCAGFLLRRRRIVEALWILFWAHLSLSGARHIPIYAIVALPLIGPQLNQWWDALTADAGRKSIAGIIREVSADISAANRRFTVFPLIVVILLPIVDQSAHWPKDFPAQKFPVSMVTRHQDLLRESRTLTMDQWADYLIFRSYPRQRVYMDGRSDFFGETVGKEYLDLMGGQENWHKILEARGFTAALIPRQWALASLMRTRPEWRLLESDELALLFVRQGIGPGTAPVQDQGSKSSSSD